MVLYGQQSIKSLEPDMKANSHVLAPTPATVNDTQIYKEGALRLFNVRAH